MSKNEISRTISCIYFMKIWVDFGFELSEVSLIHIFRSNCGTGPGGGNLDNCQLEQSENTENPLDNKSSTTKYI